jgi:hypothetical protein
MRDSLARGRARWERARPAQYLVATTSNWMMARPARTTEADGQLEAVRVRGDTIVAVIKRPAPALRSSPVWTHATVDSLFRFLAAELADPQRQMIGLLLDSLWGFPRSWHTGDARVGYGQGVPTESDRGGAVLHFEPEVVSRCARWRRLVGRCRAAPSISSKSEVNVHVA